MALRIIRKYDDEILRKRSKEVQKIDDRILKLIDDMAETMYSAEGVGLAAPQIGILKRVIVVDTGEGMVKLINPEVKSTEGNCVMQEGCLSIPGIIVEVRRPEKVIVEGLNPHGEVIKIHGEGLLARALLHEIDHLDGILFIDKAIKLIEPEQQRGE